MLSFKFEAIGTSWNIEIEEKFSENKSQKIKEGTFLLIDSFDKSFSRFREDSWVTKLSRKSGIYSLPQHAKELLNLYKEMYLVSKGLFTPCIGNTLEDAGYDSSYTLKPKKEISKPLPFIQNIRWNNDSITLDRAVLLDFGAAGKGYLVDLIANYFVGLKVKNFYIDAGGDIYYKSTKEKRVKVGLEHPEDPTMAIGYCNLINQSICASSGNRRKWDSYHHTINPITLKSPDEIIATWVIADSAALADAIATCLFLDPTPEKYKDFKFECILLYKDYKAFISKGFDGEIFTNQ